MTSLRSGVKLVLMKKLSLYIFLGLLWCNVGFAECIKGDCTNGYGTFTWKSGEFAGDRYVGEFKDGKQHGQGTFTYADGDKYIGEFKDDYLHGQGTYTWANGNKYVGEFKDGKQHGQGTFTWADGDKYVGEYKDGKQHGQGTYTYADGTVEKGIWEEGLLVEEWKDGELQNQPVEKNAKSETLQVSDILLDIQTLKGKSVEVKGFYLNVGQMAFLYEKAGSLNFISVETKNADRETRKYLLKSCSTGCEIKVKGILSEEYGMITMDLESIKK